MSSIDTRIVQMQFENSQFEKNVSETMKTLDKFKDYLTFKDSEKAIKKLQEAGDSFSLLNIVKNVELLQEKFSVLGVIGKRALENITDSAYRMGSAFIKSVSTDQISAGFNKYEDKTKSVQTIINATGKSIEEVDEQLSKLAWFTDETSYNFVDMTSNIAKFTSMNIPLDKSVTAMQGIATWAAASGQGVQEASRAMYNLSQAMGVGAVKLMDWKSIENANMATAEFKQTVIDTAIAMGTLKKEGKTAKGTAVDLKNFSQTLSEGWFTSDVLMKTLEKYGEYADEVYKVATEEGISCAKAMEKVSGETMKLGKKAFKAAQEAKTFTEAVDAAKDAVSTGWMTTFEMIFGNYEEAKELWTDVANALWEVFASGAEARNALLGDWKALEEGEGGRKDLLKGIYDIFEALYGIILAVSDAIREVFPPITLDNLKAITLKVKEFGDKLKTSLLYIEMVKSSIRRITGDAADNSVDFAGELKIGDTSEEVKQLQLELKKLGYYQDCAVDGIYGPKTEAAVKKFQEAQKLVSNGIFNRETFNKLKEQGAYAGTAFVDSIKQGERGDAVKEIQKKLIEAHYLDEGQADGIYGPKTAEAVKKFQEAQGIAADGIVNEETYNKMFPEELNERIERQEESWYVYGETLSTVQRYVRGAASIFDIFLRALKFVGQMAGHVLKIFSPLIDAFVQIGAAIADAFTSLDLFLKTDDTFSKWFESIKNFLKPFEDWIQSAADSLLNFFGLGKQSKKSNKLIESVAKPFEKVNDALNFFGLGKSNKKNKLITFTELFNNMIASIKKSKLFNALSGAFEKLGKSFDKISPKLQEYWKSFKEALGNTFTSIIQKVPVYIGAVTGAISNLITWGVDKITPWIEKLPDAIEKVKNFFKSLFDPGDVSKGKKGGALAVVKEKIKSVIDYLFGEGDPEKGKRPGLLRRIGKLLAGDVEGFTEGLSDEEKAKVIEKLAQIDRTWHEIKRAVISTWDWICETANSIWEYIKSNAIDFYNILVLLFTGNTESITNEKGETSLTTETINKVLDFRDSAIATWGSIKTFFIEAWDWICSTANSIWDYVKTNAIDLYSIIVLLFTGDENLITNEEGESALSNDTIQKVLDFRDSAIATWSSIKSFFIDAWNFIYDVAASIYDYVKSKVVDLWPTLVLLYTGNKDSISNKEGEASLSNDTIDRILQFRDNVKATWNKIKSIAISIWEWIKTNIVDRIAYIFKDGIDFSSLDGFKNSIKQAYENFGETIKDAWESIKGVISKIGEYFSKYGSILKWVLIIGAAIFVLVKIGIAIYRLSNAIGLITKGFNNMAKGFMAAKGATKPLSESIKDIAISIAIIAGAIAVLALLPEENLKRGGIAVAIIAGVLLAFGILSIVAGKLKGGENINKLGETIFDFAKAIGVLVVSLLILSAIKPETFKTGIIRLIQMLVLMVGFVAGLALVNKISGSTVDTKGILSIAGVVLMLSLVAIILGKVKEETFSNGIKRLALMMGLIVVFNLLMSLIGRGNNGKQFKGLASIAVAIGLLAFIAYLLSKMDGEEFFRGVLRLGVIMLELIVFAGLIRLFGGKNFGSAGIGLLSMVGAIAALVLLAWIIGKMDTDKLMKGILGLTALLIPFLAFTLIARIASKNGVKGMWSLIPLVVAFGILVGVFVLLATSMESIKTDALIKTIASFAAIILTLFALTKIAGSAKIGFKNFLGVLGIALVMVGMMLAFAYVLKQVKDIDTTSILAFAVSLGGLMLAFAAVGDIAGSNPLGAFLGIVAVAVGLGLVLAAFSYLLSIPGVNKLLSGGVEKIGKLIGKLIGSIQAAQLEAFQNSADVDPAKVESALGNAQQIANFMEVLGGMNIEQKAQGISALFGKKTKFQTVMDGMKELAGAFTEFSEAMTTNMPISSTMAIMINSKLALSIAQQIADFMETLTGMDIEQKSQGLSSLVGKKTSFDTVMDGMKDLGDNFNKYVTNMTGENMGLSKAPLVILNTQLALSIAKSIADFMETLTGMDIENKSQGLSSLVGKKTSFDTVMDGMNDLGDNFNKYVTKMTDGSMSLLKAPLVILNTQLALSIAGTIAEFMEKLTGMDIEQKSQGLSSWVGQKTSFDTVMEGMTTLSSNFSKYVEVITGDKLPLTKAPLVILNTQLALFIAGSIADFMETLTGMDIEQKSQGLSSWVGQKTSFDTVMEGMTTLSSNFSLYTTSMNELMPVSESFAVIINTKLAISIAESIADFMNSLSDMRIERNAGFVKRLIGEDTAFNTVMSGMSRLATNFWLYAVAMTSTMPTKNYMSIIQGTSISIFVAKAIANFMQELYDMEIETKAGAISGLFTDKTKFQTVIEGIGSMADSINNNAEKFNKISGEGIIKNVEDSITVLTSIARFLNFLSKPYINTDTGYGKAGWDQTGGWSDKVSDVTSALDTIGDSMKGLSNKLEGVDVATMTNCIQAVLSFIRFVTSDKEFSTDSFVLNFDSDAIVKKIGSFVKDLSEAIDDGTEDVETMSEMFTSSGKTLGDSFSTGFNDSQATGISNFANTFTTSLGDNSQAFVDAGASLADSVSSGMSSGKTAGASMFGFKLLAKVISYNGSFKTAGEKFAESVGSGIEVKTSIAVEAAKKLAELTLEQIKTIFNEQSPSKETEKMGEYLGDGLAIGIKNNTDIAVDSADNMVTSMLSTAKGSLATLSTLLAEDIDDTPVIRPVVDLTDARLAAGSISSLFGTQSFGVESRSLATKTAEVASNTSKATAAINQNSSNSRIIDAIHATNAQLAELTEKVDGMQVVLDSGALVGQIASPMDRKLGTMVTTRRRMG